jgi:Ubiquitin carboxyl-terminal hydrolase
MNSTIQVLRAVPELHTALSTFDGRGNTNKDLIAAMRDLYRGMGQTTEGFPPYKFLQLLRVVAPQFAETRQGVFTQQGLYCSDSISHGRHYGGNDAITIQTQMNAGFKSSIL